jgi:hypothetical protein
VARTLERLGERRLAMKAARVAPLVASSGSGQALYTLLLETLGGPANRGTFGALARALTLAALGERVAGQEERRRALAAELRWAAAGLSLRLAGLRPAAAPGRRLEAAAGLVDALWPEGDAGWPATLAPGAELLACLRRAGLSRQLGIEVAVNAVLPVAMAAREWPEEAVIAVWNGLPSPGTYGRLRRLEGWIGGAGGRRGGGGLEGSLGQAQPGGHGALTPFARAGRLQGGLLLQADYCSRGRCGACPLSS